MSDIPNGGAAFARSAGMSHGSQTGMSMRDYFAAKAMAALLTSPHFEAKDSGMVPITAYAIADAMLKQRKGGAA